MDAVEFDVFVQKLKPLHVPSDMAGIRHDLEILHGSDEPLLLLLEIPLIGEWQSSLGLPKCVQREL